MNIYIKKKEKSLYNANFRKQRKKKKIKTKTRLNQRNLSILLNLFVSCISLNFLAMGCKSCGWKKVTDGMLNFNHLMRRHTHSASQINSISYCFEFSDQNLGGVSLVRDIIFCFPAIYIEHRKRSPYTNGYPFSRRVLLPSESSFQINCRPYCLDNFR